MDGTTPETCDECGFDSRDWLIRDAGTLWAELGYWWRSAVSGIDVDDLNRRPAPAVWSALEYGLHSAAVSAVIRTGIERILAEDGCLLPAPPAVPPALPDDALTLDPDPVLAALQREGSALAALADRRLAAWTNTGRLPDGAVQAEAALLHATHDASHHFMDVARGLDSLGLGTPSATGTISQVNVSDGGIPKLPVADGVLGRRGLEADRQADRRHHGRPYQAVCLWSAEVIEELRREGHPIGAGSAGENLTLSGIDWSSLRPANRMRVGAALVELSYPAEPCGKQSRWFMDGDHSRIAHERNPRWTRWYGWVREPGRVSAGDPVTLQPG